MDPNRCDSWKIIKYRELKRTDKTIVNDIVLMHDPSRKTLCVYCNGAEIDRVFYHMEVNRYPLFKFKDNHFFVHFNETGQGFRLTFESASERTIFFKVMQKLTYISESPSKSLSQSNDDDWGAWPSHLSSQSMSQSSVRSEKRKNSSKNLASHCMSQPVYNPYGVQRPLTSSQPVMQTRPFYDFERMSPASQSSEFSISSSIRSSYSCLSNYSPSSGISQPSGLRDSPLSSESPHPFTPPMPRSSQPPQKSDKSCQTDSCNEDFPTDKAALLEHLKILMDNPEFLEMVKTVKQNMQNLDQCQLDDFKRKVNDIPEDKKVFTDLDSSPKSDHNTQTQSIVSSAPDVTQQKSEKEECDDVREWPTRGSRNIRDDFDPNEPSCSYSFTQPVRNIARMGNKRHSDIEEPSTSKTPKFRRLVDKFRK